MKSARHILISRTDSIGDVVLTLPLAGWIRNNFPEVRISFLGRDYTEPVVSISTAIDHFISFDNLKKKPVSEQISILKHEKIDCVIHVFPKSEISSLMKKAGIKWRIGTKNRMYHWFHCNSLITLSRKQSDLHESQLNFKLLEPFGLDNTPGLHEITELYYFERIAPLDPEFKKLLSADKQNIILHPKSKGSAREWGIENFTLLIKNLPKEKYQIFISGTQQEGKKCEEIFETCPEVINLTGKMNLNQFISFIHAADGLIAASTGPLHLAAALGKKAIGLFAPMRPIHPGRWKPLGARAIAISINKNCNACAKSGECACIREIKFQEVISALESL